MRTILKMCSLTAAIAAFGLAADANATRVQANAGAGWPRIPTTAVPGARCFNNSFALVSNNGANAGIANCGQNTIRWIVPLPVHGDGAGQITVTARAKGAATPTGNGVICNAFAVSSSNSGVAGPAGVTQGASAVYQDVPLGTIQVPAGGTLHVECSIAPSTTNFLVGLESITTSN